MRAFVRALLWIAGTLAVLIGLARAVAIRWWHIPADDVYLSSSLAPTLEGGDTIVLWRLTQPDLGDLVLCPEPGHPERIVIGRGRKADLALAEATISRAHAALGFDGERFFVEDLGSTNGTLVNGSRISRHALKSDDEIQMGKLRIGVMLPD